MYRIGYGEDTHKLVEGRKLVLGGEQIEYRMGLLGHSDADVLVHSICDALLGAVALGDIGKHFPDSDIRYKNVYSLNLLAHVGGILANNGYIIENTDSTIVAQEPKLSAHIEAMKKNIAKALNTDPSRVSVKATTPENTGAEGRLECITARSVVMVIKHESKNTIL